MSAAASNAPGCRLPAWFIAVMAFAASAALGQTSQANTPQKGASKPPAFSAAGVQGSTAPSGYSTGISREESSAVSEGVNTLTHTLLSGYVPDWPAQSCRIEPELVNAVQAQPQAYEPNHSLGLFYIEHGEFSRSVPYLEAARSLRPADQGNLHALALALIGDKKNQQAMDLLQSALAKSGEEAVLLRLLALAYQTAGNEHLAQETYQRAIAASPGDAGNLLAAGLGLIAAGAPQRATELFGSATAKYPKDATLWLGLGIGQEIMRRKPEAIRSLLRAIAIDRDLPPAYFFLAALADASAESAPAVRTGLAEFVVAHPSSGAAHYDYALALWLQHRMNLFDATSPEIESQLRLALAADPQMAKAHYLLGLLFADAGDLPRAENELAEAIRLDPANAEAHYHLAQDYQKTHNPQLAAAETRQFLSLRGSGSPEEPIVQPELQGAGGDLTTQLATAPPCSQSQ